MSRAVLQGIERDGGELGTVWWEKACLGGDLEVMAGSVLQRKHVKMEVFYLSTGIDASEPAVVVARSRPCKDTT